MRYECEPYRFIRIIKQSHESQLHLADSISRMGRIHMTGSMLHDRIWGKVKWKHAEAVRACEALGITRAEFKACYPYMWPLMGGD